MPSYSQRTLIGQAVSSFGKGSGEPAMITKVDRFTVTNASYTVPAGVTYMIAYIRGGGGGCGLSSAGAGGNSSVAFAGGTITANGGVAANRSLGIDEPSSYAGTANSGLGARGGNSRSGDKSIPWTAQDGALITAGDAVTAGATLAVTVGSAGTAGSSGAAGGSGYVYLEYQVKA